MQACTHTRIRAHVCAQVHTDTYGAQMHTHTYRTHTHTHTHMMYIMYGGRGVFLFNCACTHPYIGDRWVILLVWWITAEELEM